jgi:hypothetical protein
VLDAVVALLDNLAPHFDPRHAPRDVLDLLIHWLGIEHDESHPDRHLRPLVNNAAQLIGRHGVRAGVELELALNFPELPVRLGEGGGVTWSTDPDEPPPPARPWFVVHCDCVPSASAQEALSRFIERSRPALVDARLVITQAEAEG